MWSVWECVQNTASSGVTSSGAIGGGIIRRCGNLVPRYLTAKESER